MLHLTRGLTVAVAASILASCGGSPTASSASQFESPSFATVSAINAVRGTGGMGPGTPTFDGIERQWFDIDVRSSGGVVSGRMEFIDSGFVKEDGRYPHLVVGSAWPGTAILTFIPTSASCVEFTGMGYLINTGELLEFRVQTCDNGSPGAGRDSFGIEVPRRLLTHGAVYRAGPFVLVYGDVTASSTTIPLGFF